MCVVPNNGQDVLSVVTPNPNRERQKLMREQNILAQVRGHTHSHTHSPVCPSAFVWCYFLRNIQNLYRLHFWIYPFLHPAYKECNKRKSFLILSEFVIQVESCKSSSCSTAEDQSGRFVSPDLRHPQGSVRWREWRRPHAEAGGFGGSAILSLQVHV